MRRHGVSDVLRQCLPINEQGRARDMDKHGARLLRTYDVAPLKQGPISI